ncbi:unnamed protein product, partial [Linum tenue]
PPVEEAGDGFQDRAVRIQLLYLRDDAVIPFSRQRVLWYVGVVLQCRFQCFASGPFC